MVNNIDLRHFKNIPATKEFIKNLRFKKFPPCSQRLLCEDYINLFKAFKLYLVCNDNPSCPFKKELIRWHKEFYKSSYYLNEKKGE